MGQLLEDLQKLQTIETQISQVRSRLRSRENAVKAQQRRIDGLRAEYDQLHEQLMGKRKDADELDLDLKTKEDEVAKMRTALNAAKTNKEYAAILTQINTFRADNAKIEELALQKMQEAEEVGAQAEEVQQQVTAEEGKLAEISSESSAEVDRLNTMLADLQSKRDEAAAAVPSGPLDIFNRMAERYDGEAMAVIEAQGKKPPFTYTCGGCFMGLTAEHVNALRRADEVRTCDNCGRILYLDPAEEKTKV